MADLYLGVDIGGTKTHLRATAPTDGERELILPTAEWRRHDWAKDAQALVRLGSRVADGRPIAAMAVGAHGCDDAQECAAFESALVALAGFPVRVVNDAELIPAAMGVHDGIGVVAGTGSIAVTRNPDGEMLVAGGWGWVIGDEGSASGLVREAARIASLYLDQGGTPDEPLVRLLCESLGIDRTVRLGSAISGSKSAASLGSHAAAVFDAAAAGSVLAQRAIDEGAAALVDLIARLIARGARARKVVAGGGVIRAQPPLADAFLRQISSRFSNRMTARILDGPPVAGACAIARRLRPDFSQSATEENP
ncbi:N-acetylglucosamine kinase [Paracoccus methylarcula]|uniref:Sugar kinase n=1 Tax=Paracoccus methylarcula TaxID=72022 RepID=A0A422QVA3_9RHOB|nr:BadF/BadG/BcrA/BcrD ATPase family protein [Paracoccus methylarcula]RNF33888.1 sugar kinase [Paracoccus methylarcula]